MHLTVNGVEHEIRSVLFRRVALDLGRTAAATQPTDERIQAFERGDDPQLIALLFQYGRYLLIASSRPGTQPANLQGIWNDQLRAALELELHDQHQHADELLAGRADQPGRVPQAAVRHDRRPEPQRPRDRRRSTTAPAAGWRTTTPICGGRARRSAISATAIRSGRSGRWAALALPAPVGALRLRRRSRLPARHAPTRS